MCYVFFFQAEDGIRDDLVTGVQTCALPILSPADQMQENARAQALQAALARLPERQRQAVILRHIEEVGNPEIAEIMNISVEAVESLIARGKRALTTDLAAQRDELGISE